MPRIYPRPPQGEAPPEFGIDANAVQMRVIDLAVARVTPERIEVAGSVLWAVTGTAQTALVNVALNDQQRAPIPFQPGTFIRGVRFSRVFITNAAQPGVTITLLHAVEGPGNIQVENPAAQFTAVSLVPATIAALLAKPTVLNSLAHLALVAAAPAAAILPANPARRAALITSLNTNTAEILIGDLANVGPARGLQLMAGDTVVLHTIQAIAGYTPGPGNQTVTRIWTED